VKKLMRCGECGERKFERVNVKGKFFSPFREYQKVLVTTDLILPVCQNCGNYGLENDDGSKIDRAIEESLRHINV
jgi:hypothetical protein